MASKYTRGRRIRSVGDFENCNEDMFWIELGHFHVRHKGWLISWQYQYLKRMIDAGFIFIAKKKDKGDV